MERLMTVQEVAEWLNYHPEVVRRKCRMRSIPHFRIGGQLRFSGRQIRAWLDRHRVGASRAAEEVGAGV